MASDKLCYWLALVVFVFGMGHSALARHSDWLQAAGERTSALFDRVSGKAVNRMTMVQSVQSYDSSIRCAQARLAIAQTELACHRAEMQRLQAEVQRIQAIQVRRQLRLNRMVVVAPPNITVDIPEPQLPRIEVRQQKIQHEGTI